MRRRSVWFMAVLCGSLAALMPGTRVSAEASALVWPGEPLVLTAGDGDFTTSALVVNPSDLEVKIGAESAGPGDGQNRCVVSIATDTTTVPARRSKSIALTLSARPETCPDPADGTHPIVLTATDQDKNRNVVALPVKKEAAAPKQPESTGLLWPDQPVFLRRRGQLSGYFTVVNPTNETINVMPPSFGTGCEQGTTPTEARVSVPPREARPIPVVGPKNCDVLDKGDLIATATATSADETTTDTQKVVLQAEVDWDRFGFVLLVGLATLIFLAFATALITGWLQPKKRTALGDALVIPDATPSSWLTNIATVGPLLATLVTTTGLAEGLLGVESTPQSTLIIAAAAVSLALVALAGLIAGIPIKTRSVESKQQGCPMIWQFALAAGITAAAADLQIWSVRTALSRLDLPVHPTFLVGLAVAATIVLVGYLVVSVVHYIARFAEPVEKPAAEPTEDLVNAIAGALVSLSDGSPPSAAQREERVRAAAAAAQDASKAAKLAGDTGTSTKLPARERVQFTRNLI